MSRRVPGPGATVGQRWKYRRDIVIYVAWREGLSQRVLADVFDLPRSRVHAIVREVEALGGKGPGGQDGIARRPFDFGRTDRRRRGRPPGSAP